MSEANTASKEHLLHVVLRAKFGDTDAQTLRLIKEGKSALQA